MSEIILITSFLPDYNIEEIRKNSKGAISNANSNFQLSILDGFLETQETNSHLTVFNIPNIGAYPFRYKKILYKGKKEYYQNYSITDISFPNIVYLKRNIKQIILEYHLKKKIRECKEPPIIFTYDLDRSFIKSLENIKKLGYKFLSINIIPDLPGMTGTVNHWLYKKFIKAGKPNKTNLSIYDGFILLSEYMKYPLQIQDQPSIVMEGIFSDKQTDITYKPENSNDRKRYILYTGALDTRNGILNLLEAFRMISDPNINLVLCGDGDLKSHIESISIKEQRIKYLGQVSRSEAIKLQKKAFLLINPRLPSEEFASYSFPSKTLEYMASGTPLLMYKLKSMPEEYIPYIHFPKNESVEALAEKIKNLLDTNDNDLKRQGEQAKEFIINNKNASKQISRLKEFAKSLYSKKFG